MSGTSGQWPEWPDLQLRVNPQCPHHSGGDSVVIQWWWYSGDTVVIQWWYSCGLNGKLLNQQQEVKRTQSRVEVGCLFAQWHIFIYLLKNDLGAEWWTRCEKSLGFLQAEVGPYWQQYLHLFQSHSRVWLFGRRWRSRLLLTAVLCLYDWLRLSCF